MEICLEPTWPQAMSSNCGGAWSVVLMWPIATNLWGAAARDRGLVPRNQTKLLPSLQGSPGFRALAQLGTRLPLKVSQSLVSYLRCSWTHCLSASAFQVSGNTGLYHQAPLIFLWTMVWNHCLFLMASCAMTSTTDSAYFLSVNWSPHVYKIHAKQVPSSERESNEVSWRPDDEASRVLPDRKCIEMKSQCRDQQCSSRLEVQKGCDFLL